MDLDDLLGVVAFDVDDLVKQTTIVSWSSSLRQSGLSLLVHTYRGHLVGRWSRLYCCDKFVVGASLVKGKEEVMVCLCIDHFKLLKST